MLVELMSKDASILKSHDDDVITFLLQQLILDGLQVSSLNKRRPRIKSLLGWVKKHFFKIIISNGIISCHLMLVGLD